MTLTNEIPPQQIIARVAAGNALTMAAGHASESLDKFASWFLAAFAAGLVLAVSHLREISAIIPLRNIASTAYLFILAVVLCLIQKYIAMIITSGTKAAKDGRELGENLVHMDKEEFFAQILHGIPRPFRGMCKQQYDALSRGDYAASGRMFMRLTTWQSALVTSELIALLIALAKIIASIRS